MFNIKGSIFQMYVQFLQNKHSVVAFLFFFVMALASIQNAYCTCKIEVGEDKKVYISVDGANFYDAYNNYEASKYYDAYLDGKNLVVLPGYVVGAVPEHLEIINPYGPVSFGAQSTNPFRLQASGIATDYSGSSFSCTATALENYGAIRPTGSATLDLQGNFTNHNYARFNNLKIKQIHNIVNKVRLELENSTFDCRDLLNSGGLAVKNTHVTFTDLKNTGWIFAQDSLRITLKSLVTRIGNIEINGDIRFELGFEVDIQDILKRISFSNKEAKSYFNGKLVLPQDSSSSVSKGNSNPFEVQLQKSSSGLKQEPSLIPQEQSEKKSTSPKKPDFKTVTEKYLRSAGPKTSDSVVQYLKNLTLEKLQDILNKSRRECHQYDRGVKIGYTSEADQQFYAIEFGGDSSVEEDDDELYQIPDHLRLRNFQDLLWNFLYYKGQSCVDHKEIKVSLKSKDAIRCDLIGEFQQDYINITFKKSEPFRLEDIPSSLGGDGNKHPLDFEDLRRRLRDLLRCEWWKTVKKSKNPPSNHTVNFSFGDGLLRQCFECQYCQGDNTYYSGREYKNYDSGFDLEVQPIPNFYVYKRWIQEKTDQHSGNPNEKQIIGTLTMQVLDPLKLQKK